MGDKSYRIKLLQLNILHVLCHLFRGFGWRLIGQHADALTVVAAYLQERGGDLAKPVAYKPKWPARRLALPSATSWRAKPLGLTSAGVTDGLLPTAEGL